MAIYAQYMLNICSIYAEYMLNICSIYAQRDHVMTQIRQKASNYAISSPFFRASLTSCRT